MKIFGLEIGQKALESDRKARTYRGGSIGMTGDMPETTMDLFFTHYAKNSDIRGCIKELQEAVGQGGYFFREKGNEEPLEDTAPRVKEMELLLNSFQSFDMFKRRVIRDMGVAGNVYILKLKNGSGQLIGFQPIDPRTMRIVSTPYGEVVKYIQVVNGQSQDFAPEEVYHWIDEQDPDNEIFGLSILEGIIYEVLADSEASLTNYYYFKNNAIPATLIQLEDGMSEDEQEIAIEQLKKQFRGAKNRHKIGAVSGVKGFQKLQDGNKDMEFLNMRMFTTQRVCAAFGVPKVILNYTDGVNYTNADMQYTKYIDNTVRPWEEKFAKMLTDMINEVDEKIEFRFNDDHINDEKERTATQVQQISSGIKTINEVRSDNGDEKYKFPEADTPMITRTLTPLDMAGLDNFPTTVGETPPSNS